MTERQRVVVTGMGLVSCFGSDVDIFYDKLLAGDSGVGLIKAFPCEDSATRIAAEVTGFEPEEYIDKKQIRRIDPCIAYALVAGKKAFEHANLDKSFDELNKERCGVLVGSGMGGMHVYVDGVKTMTAKGGNRVSPFFIPYIITNMSGGLLAKEYGFMGPNYSISTACATGNHSILSAARHISSGEADLMICGGVEAPILDVGLHGFIACKAISRRNNEPTKASRPWDVNRDGFVMGEGAGILVLESLEHAQKRGATIYAEFLGGSLSCDAYHMTLPREDGLGIVISMENALKDASITPHDVDYVNAHATSTVPGDIAEMVAIEEVFKDDLGRIKVNATKSMTGHCLGAAGGIEAIATVKAINTGKLHPTINLDDPEPELKFDVVPHVPQDCDVNVAISNSFGFGGHNSVLVLGKFKG